MIILMGFSQGLECMAQLQGSAPETVHIPHLGEGLDLRVQLSQPRMISPIHIYFVMKNGIC